MTAILFWALLAIVVYTYVVFPLLVLLRAWWRPRSHQSGRIEPYVSIIIAAHNEADCIGRKIENMLQLDYPAGRYEIIIASDGSSDQTDAITARYASCGVRLMSLPRGGKAQALNAAVAAAEGDVLVFSDANSMFDSGALRALVAPLADSAVGGVAGDQRYERSQAGDTTSCGERGYWSFDRWLKQAESRAGNVISATGAIYAIRRSLFVAVPEGVTDDFVTSTRVIEQGYRLVFAPDALAREPVSAETGVEFARKVRIIGRGLRAVWVMRSLLIPWRHGFYSLQLLSHKVLRRLAVIPLLALLVLSIWLWPQAAIYRWLACGQVAVLLLAAGGMAFRLCNVRAPRLLVLPLYFCMVNLAALVAIARLLRGHSIVVWQPQRCGEQRVVAR